MSACVCVGVYVPLFVAFSNIFLKDILTNDDSLYKSVSNNGVCRTAPATLSLLNTDLIKVNLFLLANFLTENFVQRSWLKMSKEHVKFLIILSNCANYFI